MIKSCICLLSPLLTALCNALQLIFRQRLCLRFDSPDKCGTVFFTGQLNIQHIGDIQHPCESLCCPSEGAFFLPTQRHAIATFGLKLFWFLYRGSKNCRILYCPAHLKCLIFLLSQMMDCFLTSTSLLYTPQNVLKLMTCTFIEIKTSMINFFFQLWRRTFFLNTTL